MEKVKNFLDLAEFILKYKKEPLNEFEIWSIAKELIENKVIDFITDGKTPWRSIGARVYMNIKNHPNDTKFIKLVKPKRFTLKEYLRKQGSEDTARFSKVTKQNQSDNTSNLEDESEKERDLHKYLVYWLAKEKEIYSKTIFHEKSLKNKIKDGEIRNQWLYPDMIGVEFSFSYADDVTKLVNNIAVPLVKLYSYELKKELTASNVRECYFQAVSNSSWANEGYLVVEKIDLEQSMDDELQRLNNAFGIGVIQLCTKEDVLNTVILYPSRVKDNIDIGTVNHLANYNPNVKTFIKTVNEIVEIKKNQKDPTNQGLYIDTQIKKHFDKIDEFIISFED